MPKKRIDSKSDFIIKLNDDPELLPGFVAGFAGQIKLATKLSRGRFRISCSLPGPMGRISMSLFIIPKKAVELIYPL